MKIHTGIVHKLTGMGLISIRKIQINNKIVNELFWWVLVIGWAIFIFIQSAENSEISGGKSAFVVNILNNAVKTLTGVQKPVFTELFIRKTAHFLEYFIMGFLLYNALAGRKELRKALLLTIILGTLYAVSDEIHQYFVPGRTMSIYDVIIDCAGLMTGTLMTFLFYFLRIKEKL